MLNVFIKKRWSVLIKKERGGFNEKGKGGLTEKLTHSLLGCRVLEYGEQETYLEYVDNIFSLFNKKIIVDS